MGEEELRQKLDILQKNATSLEEELKKKKNDDLPLSDPVQNYKLELGEKSPIASISKLPEDKVSDIVTGNREQLITEVSWHRMENQRLNTIITQLHERMERMRFRSNEELRNIECQQRDEALLDDAANTIKKLTDEAHLHRDIMSSLELENEILSSKLQLNEKTHNKTILALKERIMEKEKETQDLKKKIQLEKLLTSDAKMKIEALEASLQENVQEGVNRSLREQLILNEQKLLRANSQLENQEKEILKLQITNTELQEYFDSCELAGKILPRKIDSFLVEHLRTKYKPLSVSGETPDVSAGFPSLGNSLVIPFPSIDLVPDTVLHLSPEEPINTSPADLTTLQVPQQDINMPVDVPTNSVGLTKDPVSSRDTHQSTLDAEENESKQQWKSLVHQISRLQKEKQQLSHRCTALETELDETRGECAQKIIQLSNEKNVNLLLQKRKNEDIEKIKKEETNRILAECEIKLNDTIRKMSQEADEKLEKKKTQFDNQLKNKDRLIVDLRTAKETETKFLSDKVDLLSRELNKSQHTSALIRLQEEFFGTFMMYFSLPLLLDQLETMRHMLATYLAISPSRVRILEYGEMKGSVGEEEDIDIAPLHLIRFPDNYNADQYVRQYYAALPDENEAANELKIIGVMDGVEDKSLMPPELLKQPLRHAREADEKTVRVLFEICDSPEERGREGTSMTQLMFKIGQLLYSDDSLFEDFGVLAIHIFRGTVSANTSWSNDRIKLIEKKAQKISNEMYVMAIYKLEDPFAIKISILSTATGEMRLLHLLETDMNILFGRDHVAYLLRNDAHDSQLVDLIISILRVVTKEGRRNFVAVESILSHSRMNGKDDKFKLDQIKDVEGRGGKDVLGELSEERAKMTRLIPLHLTEGTEKEVFNTRIYDIDNFCEESLAYFEKKQSLSNNRINDLIQLRDKRRPLVTSDVSNESPVRSLVKHETITDEVQPNSIVGNRKKRIIYEELIQLDGNYFRLCLSTLCDDDLSLLSLSITCMKTSIYMEIFISNAFSAELEKRVESASKIPRKPSHDSVSTISPNKSALEPKKKIGKERRNAKIPPGSKHLLSDWYTEEMEEIANLVPNEEANSMLLSVSEANIGVLGLEGTNSNIKVFSETLEVNDILLYCVVEEIFYPKGLLVKINHSKLDQTNYYINNLGYVNFIELNVDSLLEQHVVQQNERVFESERGRGEIIVSSTKTLRCNTMPVDILEMNFFYRNIKRQRLLHILQKDGMEKKWVESFTSQALQFYRHHHALTTQYPLISLPLPLSLAPLGPSNSSHSAPNITNNIILKKMNPINSIEAKRFTYYNTQLKNNIYNMLIQMTINDSHVFDTPALPTPLTPRRASPFDPPGLEKSRSPVLRSESKKKSKQQENVTDSSINEALFKMSAKQNLLQVNKMMHNISHSRPALRQIRKFTVDGKIQNFVILIFEKQKPFTHIILCAISMETCSIRSMLLDTTALYRLINGDVRESSLRGISHWLAEHVSLSSMGDLFLPETKEDRNERMIIPSLLSQNSVPQTPNSIQHSVIAGEMKSDIPCLNRKWKHGEQVLQYGVTWVDNRSGSGRGALGSGCSEGSIEQNSLWNGRNKCIHKMNGRLYAVSVEEKSNDNICRVTLYCPITSPDDSTMRDAISLHSGYNLSFHWKSSDSIQPMKILAIREKTGIRKRVGEKWKEEYVLIGVRESPFPHNIQVSLRESHLLNGMDNGEPLSGSSVVPVTTNIPIGSGEQLAIDPDVLLDRAISQYTATESLDLSRKGQEGRKNDKGKEDVIDNTVSLLSRLSKDYSLIKSKKIVIHDEKLFNVFDRITRQHIVQYCEQIITYGIIKSSYKTTIIFLEEHNIVDTNRPSLDIPANYFRVLKKSFSKLASIEAQSPEKKDVDKSAKTGVNPLSFALGDSKQNEKLFYTHSFDSVVKPDLSPVPAATQTITTTVNLSVNPICGQLITSVSYVEKRARQSDVERTDNIGGQEEDKGENEAENKERRGVSISNLLVQHQNSRNITMNLLQTSYTLFCEVLIVHQMKYLLILFFDKNPDCIRVYLRNMNDVDRSFHFHLCLLNMDFPIPMYSPSSIEQRRTGDRVERKSEEKKPDKKERRIEEKRAEERTKEDRKGEEKREKGEEKGIEEKVREEKLTEEKKEVEKKEEKREDVLPCYFPLYCTSRIEYIHFFKENFTTQTVVDSIILENTDQEQKELELEGNKSDVRNLFIKKIMTSQDQVKVEKVLTFPYRHPNFPKKYYLISLCKVLHSPHQCTLQILVFDTKSSKEHKLLLNHLYLRKLVYALEMKIIPSNYPLSALYSDGRRQERGEKDERTGAWSNLVQVVESAVQQKLNEDKEDERREKSTILSAIDNYSALFVCNGDVELPGGVFENISEETRKKVISLLTQILTLHYASMTEREGEKAERESNKTAEKREQRLEISVNMAVLDDIYGKKLSVYQYEQEELWREEMARREKGGMHERKESLGRQEADDGDNDDINSILDQSHDAVDTSPRNFLLKNQRKRREKEEMLEEEKGEHSPYPISSISLLHKPFLSNLLVCNESKRVGRRIKPFNDISHQRVMIELFNDPSPMDLLQYSVNFRVRVSLLSKPAIELLELLSTQHGVHLTDTEIESKAQINSSKNPSRGDKKNEEEKKGESKKIEKKEERLEEKTGEKKERAIPQNRIMLIEQLPSILFNSTVICDLHESEEGELYKWLTSEMLLPLLNPSLEPYLIDALLSTLTITKNIPVAKSAGVENPFESFAQKDSLYALHFSPLSVEWKKKIQGTWSLDEKYFEEYYKE